MRAAAFDGKVIVGGGFTNIGGMGRNNIARLNPDGSVDSGFDPGSGADYMVYRVLLQHDGKVLMAGGFETVNGATRHLLARLHADGSLDEEFNPKVNGYPTLGLQANGKILLGGYFTKVNGVPCKYIARLNEDGTLDTDFVSVDLDGSIASLTPLKSGKILITGGFSRIAGVSRSRIARLNEDGTLDTGFNPAPDGPLDVGLVTIFTEQPDGKLLVWGNFTNINGVPRSGVARLNTDGTLDSHFETPVELLGTVRCAALQADGNIIFGGYFSAVGGLPRCALVRVFAEPPAPVIVTQPTSQTCFVGRPAILTVEASGPPVLVYRWYRNGLPLSNGPQISGATSPTLNIRHARFQDSGSYRVAVSNTSGSVYSDPAWLTVITPDRNSRRQKNLP